ncbi:MAG: AAA family ATPase [Candidatus Taylorbacteria bacterium]|nr:AAA family ATPase [Candidatus Taylorbacteria bacterium]
MYLKSLEITGFKSFAKKTELNFTTQITSIVGPNGSGKSNIAEAFRFVLGEQSIKSMRGKRTEDLIWNGGGDAARANRASVKVVFDNRKRILNVDFDEVSVERVIYRDSSSEYSINGTLVRLKDVVELLAGAHIGSSGHHIISQGEADKILNANTKERREMLEDALGLKIFEYKREESERKLEKTEENMKQVESLRREIKPHLTFLKKQVEKIEKTLELKEELRKSAKEYFKRENAYISHTKETIKTERHAPSEQLKHLEHELAKAKEVLAQSSTHDAKSDEIIKLDTDLASVRNEKDTLARELGRIEGAISSEERIIKREREAVAQEGAHVVPLSEVERVTSEITERMSALEQQRDENALSAFFAFVRKTFSTFIAQHKTAGAVHLVAQSETEIANLKKERHAIEEKVTACVKREEELHRALLTLQADINREKDSSREAERAVFRIMSEESTLRNTLASIAMKEERLTLVEADFKRALQEVAMLVGRDVIDFDTYSIVDEKGVTLDALAMTSEERVSQEDRKRLIEKMKIRIEDAGAGGGEDVVKEFRETSERDAFFERELVDLHKSAESLRALIVELAEKLDNEFREGVAKINTQFGQFFTLMFGGGSASLQIVREAKRKRGDTDVLFESGEDLADTPDEETQEGIEIAVSLPRKKIKGLMMLSGGERALTSIALLFAVSQVNPPPFVILDETDAALDEANSKKYGDMIESLSKLSQLILITHNRETMSRAGVLYGVTMTSAGMSKLLSIAFDQAVAVAK